MSFLLKSINLKPLIILGPVIALSSFLLKKDKEVKYTEKWNELSKYEQNQNPPEENRFTKVVLAEKLEEPMELAILPDNKILIIGRKGEVTMYDPSLSKIQKIGNISVNTKYTSGTEAEDGLLGLAVDPNFTINHWIYLYYAQEGNEPKNILTRYQLIDDQLIQESKKILLEVKTQREQCCHTGGSIAFDSKGNLYLSTGDNTNPFNSSGFSPSDEREERSAWDAQRSSGNTNDLRGKILRIHPQADGTYTIPDGNLFPQGSPKTRPEIYTMGHRNPFRISVDKKTGYVYWGEVGPDSNFDSIRGPRGYDEINLAKGPGNFGWPFVIADNKAYARHNFAKNKFSEYNDPDNLLNTSPNNTGLTNLPPAQKAMIWYPYGSSEEFPLVGSGGRTAMAGPVFYTSDFQNAKRSFPSYYDGKLIIYEWIRGWIMAVTMDKDGNYQSMERIMPNTTFSNPIDMEFGPEGDLYIIEYGARWFNNNDDARLVRIEYNGGNRKPVANIEVNKIKGATPFVVKFSAKKTIDYDSDSLNFLWTINKNGKTIKTLEGASPSYTFIRSGVYQTILTVTDTKGEQSHASIEIVAGNEPPKVDLEIIKGNKTFFFKGQNISYNTKITDKEDGSLSNGKILPSSITVTADYLKEGFDKVSITQGHSTADVAAIIARGKTLLEGNDCKSCHTLDNKSIGPSYKSINLKYKGQPDQFNRLVKKIINGGSGVWGETAMPAHPNLKEEQSEEIVKYILTFDTKREKTLLPLSGIYTVKLPEDEPALGTFIFRASYTDKRINEIPSITSEETIVLRSPKVFVSDADETKNINLHKPDNVPYFIATIEKAGAYLGLKNIDLTNISNIDFYIYQPLNKHNGGKIEVHLDSPNGKLIGMSTVIPSKSEQTIQETKLTTVEIGSTNGFHNIYFVFLNEDSPKNQPMMELSSIQFHLIKD